MPTDLLQVYEQSLGLRPRDIAPESLGGTEVAAFVEAHATHLEGNASSDAETRGLWPLISHHQFNRGGLFTPGSRPIGERALTYLLAYDGLVISDPTITVSELYDRGQVDDAVRELRLVTGRLGQIQALLNEGAVRVISDRPSLASSARSQVLEAFRIDPEMTVFTNFINAYDAAMQLRTGPESSYVRQAEELLERLRITSVPLRDVDHARQTVERVGRALIHLSWQLSVCTADRSCDLSLNDPLEERLIELLLQRTDLVDRNAAAGLHATRHLRRMQMGDVPSVDTLDLTISDALAIRRDNAFEEFRDSLQSALDDYDTHVRTTLLDGAKAEADFQLRMREASRSLSERVPRTSFAARVKESVVPTGLAVAGLLLPTGSAMQLIASAAGTPLAAVMFGWLTGRMKRDGRAVAVRYSAHLGSPRRSRS
jgi:hypothetical protein